MLQHQSIHSFAPVQQMHVPRASAQVSQPIPVEHTDVIHDTQFDYYGKLLATASSDRTIGVHLAQAGAPLQRVATLSGHEGPVWMVSWAHPRFGNMLASCGYDQRAIVWKEKPQGSQKWAPIHVVDIHQGSVNAVQWAPPECGPMIATASSDGSVAVTTHAEGCWQESVKLSNNANQIAHAMGATCVSFAPVSSLLKDVLVLASGGCDCSIRVWVSAAPQPSGAQANSFHLHQTLDGHSEWVRDVAFCPTSSATGFLMLASCGQDKTVVLHRKSWKQLLEELHSGTHSSSEAPQCSAWERSVVSFDVPVWRLSWSAYGQTLVVTTADSEVFVLQEATDFTEPWIKTPLSDLQQ